MSSRYNGPGAGLRGQPRAPRQRSRPRDHTDNTSYSNTDRQQAYIDKDIPDVPSPRSYQSSHQRQWSDASSLQGGTLPPTHYQQQQPYQGAQNYPYSNNHQSPYMGPSSGSPASPPPLSSSPSSSSSYFYSPDQRSHSNAYPPSQRHQQYQHQGSSQSKSASRAGGHAYSPGGRHDQSPMMSPTTPDSWRSPPGPRGYGSQAPQYSSINQHRQHPHQKPYPTASSVSNDDHLGFQHRPSNRGHEYDSDDYYNRSGGRNGAPSYGSSQDQGQNWYNDDRDRGRSERNERKEPTLRPKPHTSDEWSRSPTGTENETEILPWSDDEAIVTKAIRSPPTEYLNEKTLPPIPSKGAVTNVDARVNVNYNASGRSMDSDMIKVEVGETTTVIPTTSESFGVNFVKNIPSSPSMALRYNNSNINNVNTSYHQAPTGAIQSMAGAASALRAAAALGNQKTLQDEAPVRLPRSTEKPMSSEWDGQRISLDDMLSSPPTVIQDSRQQAINSWRTYPPLHPREDNSEKSFVDLKGKRRSSLPDKFVPNWNEHTENWRNSIGQRRPSWMADSKGGFYEAADNAINTEIDPLARKPSWAKDRQVPEQTSVSTNAMKDHQDNYRDTETGKFKRLSDQGTDRLHRRSRSWSPPPGLIRNDAVKESGHLQSDQAEYETSTVPSNVWRHDSYASTISQSRSRSRSASSQRRSRDLKSRGSYSRSRSPSLNSRDSSSSRSRYRSRSCSRSRSLSRSRSRCRSRSPRPHSRGSDEFDGIEGSVDTGLRKHGSTRFSWRSIDDASPNPRRSWETTASLAINTDVKGYGFETHNMSNSTLEGREPVSRSSKGTLISSDSDSQDSPPLKVQYGRRALQDDDDDDNQTVSSKYPVSIISTLNLPPATSPTSPPIPPIPSTYPSTAASSPYSSFAPPPIPDSPALTGTQSQSLMTSVTNVSIEATIATIQSSRVSVESFRTVPGQDQDVELDFEADTIYDRGLPPISSSFVSMTTVRGDDDSSSSSNRSSTTSSTVQASTAPTSAPRSNPLSVTTKELRRNGSSTNSASPLSARSARSFMSPLSAHSVTSILSASPPPQRAPPPIPVIDSNFDSASPTVGSGLFNNTTKRSGSGGGARGMRSGLSKQVLPANIPPPSDTPVGGAQKPSYGIIPPPIPSSFNNPSMNGDSAGPLFARMGAVVTPAVAATTSAVQIQMLADEDQSKSQIGAITIEGDERLLTRLNNRIAQLEKELEFAQQDLEASQDDAQELQSKVNELENEIQELKMQNPLSRVKLTDDHQKALALEKGEESKSARETWEQERAQLLKDMNRLREEHKEELEESAQQARSKHEQELERLTLDHAAALKDQLIRVTEEHSKALEMQREYLQADHQQAIDNLTNELNLLGIKHTQDLETLRSEHETSLTLVQTEINELGIRFEVAEKSLSTVTLERDQAVKDLQHHKKETELALDRLEIVLAEDKRAHAQLVQGLEGKSKRLQIRVTERESQLRELMQDNVQIVEEMQRREESWEQERILLRSSANEDESARETRLQEMHEQLVTMTESKRQADMQFQGIVKGLLREASVHKKELAERQMLLDQERESHEQLQQQLGTIQQEVETLKKAKLTLEQEALASQNKTEALLHDKEALEREKQALEQEKKALLQERDSTKEQWAALENNQKAIESQLEAQKRSDSEAMQNIHDELSERLHHQEKLLEAERAKIQELERALEEKSATAKNDLQQDEFMWKNRLDQVEAALKTKEAQVRKLEQEADATMKIQTDLIQSMERDAANTQKKLEASLAAKMHEMEQAFEEEKRRIKQQTHDELTHQYEQDSVQKEQQLESIHQQELETVKQELTIIFEQQLQEFRDQHDSALEESNMLMKQQQRLIQEQLERLQQQLEKERSEKEAAINQSRTKFGQDLQEVERSKMSLERKLNMTREDLEELNKIRDELEDDREKLRMEVERLKNVASRSSRGGQSPSGGGAWETERRSLQERIHKLEGEMQIILEKNMHLTIELSMR